MILFVERGMINKLSIKLVNNYLITYFEFVQVA